jgi:membrane protein YdbS with pleckstrin-like domain
MRYRVIGSDEVSGETMELVVEAADEAEARFKAGARGLITERVEEAGASAPPEPPRRRAPERESSGLDDRDDDRAQSDDDGPERDVWAGGPSQWINTGKFLLALVAAVVLVLGAVFIPKWLGHDRIVWLAILGALAIPAVYAFVVWLLTRTHRYRVTDQRIEVKTGILTRHVEQVELYRVVDAAPTQTIAQRVVRCGTLTLETTDKSMPSVRLAWVPNHLGLWDRLRPIIAERRRHHRILEGVGEL